MTHDAVIGAVLIIVGLLFISYITFKGRSIIDRIARRKSGTAREIIKDMNNDG